MERREFLTMLAALQAAAKLDAQRSNGMIYRNLGTTGQRVSALGLGGYHMGVPKEERVSELYGAPSTAASRFSITHAITTMGAAKSAWVRR